MKTIFIILVLLAVAEWKKKEACKTKGRGWTWYQKDGKASTVRDPYGVHHPLTANNNDDDDHIAATYNIYSDPRNALFGDDEQLINLPVNIDDSYYALMQAAATGSGSGSGGTDTNNPPNNPAVSPDNDQNLILPYIINDPNPSDHPDTAVLPDTIDDAQNNDATIQKVVHECHVLIIGAGAETVAILGRLKMSITAERKKRILPEQDYRVHIIIVEEKSKFGPGSTYDSDEVIPEHLMNNFLLYDLSIIENGRLTDFQNWESANRVLHPNQYELKFDRDGNIELPPPRSLVGQYLEQRFNELVDECKEMFLIKLLNDTSAGKVFLGDRGFLVVELSDGSEVHTTDIVLATGHWSSSLFGKDKVEGFFPSPWPASALTHRVTGIPAHAKVGILDSTWNAIDAAMTLAHKHGNFTPARQKPHGFDYKPNSKDFQITMYSRYGILPAVMGKIGQYPFSETDAMQQEFLSLDELVKVLRIDFAKSAPVVNINQFGDANRIIQQIDDIVYYNRLDARKRLEQDIKRARESSQRNVRLVFQCFFAGTLDYFNKYLLRFSPEDKFTFETEIAPRILKYARPIPLDTAEKLLALIKAGCLVIVAGDKIEVDKGNNNKGVRVKYQKTIRGTIHSYEYLYDYFIDATEQSGDIKRNPSPLVQSLFENGFIRPNYLDLHPLPNDDKRIEEFEVEDQTTYNIQRYRSNGIKMDTETMRAIPPYDLDAPPRGIYPDGQDAARVIYATGPFTLGHYPFGQTLPHVINSADLIVYDILSRRLPIVYGKIRIPVAEERKQDF